MPYKADSFDATQEYRYRCRNLDITNLPRWTGITIAREVADSTGKGCWGYKVTKSGYSASESPMPGVNPMDCTTALKTIDDQAFPETVSTYTNSRDEITLSVSLPRQTVGLHAPVFFDLSVANRTSGTIGIDLGLNRKSNLELSIQTPAGSVETRRLSSDGFGGSGEMRLKPGRAYVKRLPVNEWFDFRKPGTYHITVTLRNPANEADEANRPSAEFSVQIGPRNPAELRSIAQALAQEAISSPTIAESMEAANALSYIRDSVAVESLSRVLQDGALVENYAVDGLERIGGSEAIAALQAAQDHPDPEVREAVRNALDRLQNQLKGTSGPKD
jgi:hypothetical protein